MNWMTVTSRWKCTNKLEKRMQKGHNKTKSSEKPEYRLRESEKKRKECDNDAERMRLQRKKTKQNKIKNQCPCNMWAIQVCAAVKGMVFKQFTLALHSAGAREILIDQSGFSRREKLYCPDVKRGKAPTSDNFSH